MINRASPELLIFVEGWEDLRTSAYLDGGGVPTIGIGRTRGVKMGDTCTEDQARAWFADEMIAKAEHLSLYLTREPTQQQMDAMCSLAFNVGVDGPAGLGVSGLVARFNAGRDQECADRFLLWCRDSGVVIPGLLKRRKAERDIYLDGDYSGRP